MRSFKEYQAEGNTSAEAATAEELTKKIADAYHGKSNMDMLKSILAEAEKSKRAGTLSNDDIDNFYKSFAPMLNGFQKKQLKTVVDKLKEI